MITIAFEKTDNAIYVAHTDILRCLNRTFRRAGILVNYSKGFNRHMSLKLTQPLPFGVASKEEWVTADIDKEYEESEILKLFNDNCPPFLKAYKAYKVDANPNLGGKVVASDYFIANEKAIEYKDEILNALKTLEISSENKRREVIVKKVADLLYKTEIDEKGIYILCGFGNKNLRMDLVIARLNELYNLEIENTDLVRLRQYVELDEVLVLADDYVKSLI
jgi:radical SAM-linked protein